MLCVRLRRFLQSVVLDLLGAQLLRLHIYHDITVSSLLSGLSISQNMGKERLVQWSSLNISFLVGQVTVRIGTVFVFDL
jgi:hypothetical protein